jgi:hypothetical protein
MESNLDLFSYSEKKDSDMESAFVACLELAAGWRLAKDIPLERRAMRSIAQHNHHILSGNKGYILDKYATLDERKEAAGRLISQGREMTRRGIRILRHIHI